MSLQQAMQHICTQTAVYWAPGTADSHGEITFEAPVEINVRWEDSTERIATANGSQILCHAKVFVTAQYDKQGYLFLGTLADCSSNADPKTVDGAFEILRADKIPAFRSKTVFLHTLYL
jgi:hypothetical protein